MCSIKTYLNEIDFQYFYYQSKMIDYDTHHRQTPNLNLSIYSNEHRLEPDVEFQINDTERLNDSSSYVTVVSTFRSNYN